MITIYLKSYNKIVRNADVKLFDDLGYDDILWIDLLAPTIKEQKAVENISYGTEIQAQTEDTKERMRLGREIDFKRQKLGAETDYFAAHQLNRQA